MLQAPTQFLQTTTHAPGLNPNPHRGPTSSHCTNAHCARVSARQVRHEASVEVRAARDQLQAQLTQHTQMISVSARKPLETAHTATAERAQHTAVGPSSKHRDARCQRRHTECRSAPCAGCAQRALRG
eukprot:6733420-Prymnesium_polylepis.1